MATVSYKIYSLGDMLILFCDKAEHQNNLQQ